MDPDGIQRVIVGRVSRFGWLVYYLFDNSTDIPIGGLLAHLGIH
jgi:hypothetical protein